jgi:hypothetical protein
MGVMAVAGVVIAVEIAATSVMAVMAVVAYPANVEKTLVQLDAHLVMALVTVDVKRLVMDVKILAITIVTIVPVVN